MTRSKAHPEAPVLKHFGYVITTFEFHFLKLVVMFNLYAYSIAVFRALSNKVTINLIQSKPSEKFQISPSFIHNVECRRLVFPTIILFKQVAHPAFKYSNSDLRK